MNLYHILYNVYIVAISSKSNMTNILKIKVLVLKLTTLKLPQKILNFKILTYHVKNQQRIKTQRFFLLIEHFLIIKMIISKKILRVP